MAFGFYQWAEKQLKPCPFCGESKIDILCQPEGWFLIRCWNCPASMRIYTKYQRQLIAFWNHRPKE
jgi:hypothetical protein